MDSDDDVHEVQLARRGTPSFASPLPPGSLPRRARVRRPRVARGSVRPAALTMLAVLTTSLLVLGVGAVLGRGGDPAPSAAAPPPATTASRLAVPSEPVDPDPPVVLVAEDVRPVAGVRARVRVTTTGGSVRVRLSSPTTGRVRWTVRGARGRVMDRVVLRIGPRPQVHEVRGLPRGRYTWRVVPRLDGPTRRGRVSVAGPAPVPVPDPAPAVEAPLTSPPPAPADRSGSTGRPPGRPGKQRPVESAQLHHPQQQHEVDPDDVPDPVDPSQRTVSTR